jgi:ABC-type lipoprotein release transport system permease subunit
MLYGVTARDPSVFLLVALTLSFSALFASWAPAVRAALVDPVITLRYE